MNQMKLILTIILTFVGVFTLLAQTPKHEKKIYKNDEGKVYINKDLPVYLSVSSNPDGSDGTVIDGVDPKYSSPMYLDSEGYNSIRTPWKVDPETRKIVYPKEDVVFVVYADSRPPNTTITFSAKDQFKMDDTKILNSGTFALSATDELSGIQSIYYSLNGTPYTAYTSDVAIAPNQTYEIKYYAVDHVGNAEEAKSISIQTDDNAPVTTFNIEGDLIKNVVSARSSFTLSAEDDIPGVKSIFYTIDYGKTYTYNKPIKLTTLSEGEHTITYFAVDKVENKEEKKSYTFFLDKSAPRVIDEIIGNTFVANGKEYYSGRTKLKLVSMDNKAGVKEVRYSINGGEFTLYEEPFYLTQAGNLNIEVLAMDKVNNRDRTTAFSGKDNLTSYVDLSGPSLSYSLLGPSFNLKDTVYISKETKLQLKGKDSDSGFKEIDYQIDNGESVNYAEPFSIEQEGFHNITYNGYDNLSNSSTDNILIIVDNTGPEVFNRFSIDSNKTKVMEGQSVNVYPPHVVLFLSSTDHYAGLDKINYQINGGSVLPYRSLIENFKKDTLYKINVIVVDKLGNENQEEITFYIE